MAISTAITSTRVSGISGYEVDINIAGIKAGNLPQRIDVFAEKASTHQTAPQFLLTTSANEVGNIYGFSSPQYAIARILRPKSGGKLQSIPTYFWGIDQAVGAVAKAKQIVVSVNATGNATHYLRINGRTSLDGVPYAYSVVTGDTPAVVAQKMVDVCNAVVGCPVKATITSATVTFTAGWKGETSNRVTVEVETNGSSIGTTYTAGTTVAGSGISSIAGISNIGDSWSTHVINGLGNTTGVLTALETFNGNIESSTGRYEASVWKPFHAFTGTTLSTLSTLSAAFGSRGTEETNVICVAPNTECMDFEIAADYVYNHAPIAQDTPNLCVYGNSAGKYLTNIVPPKDGNIGEFGDSNMRDILVKAGFCTVKLTDGKYEMIDLVTTRNVPEYPQESMPYRWVRDNNIIWNMKYALKIYEDLYVKGKTIVGDTDTVSASNTISPNRYISILDTKYFPDLIDRALIISYSGLLVGKGTTNPNRFETYFESTLTGVARVISTTMSISNNF
jgi:hypothetical protein